MEQRVTVPSAPPLGWIRRKFTAEVRPRSEGQRRRAYLLAVVLAVLGAAGFAVLLVDVVHHEGVALIDPPLQRTIEHLRAPLPTAVFVVLAVAFGPIGMPIVVAVVAAVWFVRARHAWRPILLAAAMLTGVVLAEVIAHLVGRPRPPLAQMLLGPDHTKSFPSGHLLGIANFCLTGSYLLLSRSRRIAPRIVLPIVAVVLIALMLVDRVYLGYHWPTDTLASFCLALLEVGIVIAVDTWRTVETHGHPAPATAEGRESTGAPALDAGS